MVTTLGTDEDESSLLADAVLQNLKVRKSADFNAKFSSISMCRNEYGNICKEKFEEDLAAMNIDSSRELFFVFLGNDFAILSKTVAELIRDLSSKNEWLIYGLHFQNITTMAWKALSSTLQCESVETMCVHKSRFPMTGLLSSTALCSDSYPLLLYLIHLAVGENGFKKLKKAAACGAGNYSSSGQTNKQTNKQTSIACKTFEICLPHKMYVRLTSHLS